MQGRIAAGLISIFARTAPGYIKGSVPLENGQFSHFIDVNISTPVFEVPMFLMYYFIRHLRELCEEQNTHLIAPLFTLNLRTDYKTIPSILAKSVLRSSFTSDRLYKVVAPKTEAVYYATQGAVFDKDMNPIFMCSWKIRKWEEMDGDAPVHRMAFVEPVVRISPDNYLVKKSDAVQSFINNKILNTFLSEFVATPNDNTYPYLDKGWLYRKPKVILEDIPFSVTQPKTPDINTTQECLRNIVSEHIDDLDALTV